MDEGTSFGLDSARVLRPEAEVTSCRQGFSRGTLVRASFDHEYLERLKNRDDDTERHFTTYFSDLLRIKLRARLLSPQVVED